jgi:hypothetical protein
MSARPGYWIHEWDEESNYFDARSHLNRDGFYVVTCRMWIPDIIVNDEDIEDYVASHLDDTEAGINFSAELP